MTRANNGNQEYEESRVYLDGGETDGSTADKPKIQIYRSPDTSFATTQQDWNGGGEDYPDIHHWTRSDCRTEHDAKAWHSRDIHNGSSGGVRF